MYPMNAYNYDQNMILPFKSNIVEIKVEGQEFTNVLLHLMVFGYPKNESLSIEFKLIMYYDSYLIYE